MESKKIKLLKEWKKIISSLAVMVSISQLFGTSAYALDSDVYTEENTTTIETNDTITTSTNVKVSYSDSEVIDNKDDAIDKEKEYEDKQENIKNEVESLNGTYDYTVDITEDKGPITEIEFNCEADSLEELEKEIDNKKEELGDIDVIKVDIEESSEKENLGSFDFDENYETIEEVQDAIDEKTEEIQKSGGVLLESSIEEEYVETRESSSVISLEGKSETEIEKIVKEYESLNTDRCHIVVVRKILDVNTGIYIPEIISETCDSRDEAIEKMKEMEKQGYIVDYSNIIERRNYEKDVITSVEGDVAYDTLEEAEKASESLEIETNEVKVVATIRKETFEKEEIIIENKSFETEEAAEAYIKELEDNGYIVENYEINKVIDNTGKVTEASKDDESKTLYVFDSNKTNFVLIKQANDYYAVWTNEQLSDDEKNEFVNSYNQINSGSTKFDGSTQNIDLSQIIFLNGYDSFDLSFLGNQWGTYTFSKTDDNLNLDIPSQKISHAVFGYCIETVKEFLLNATASLTGEKYYVDLEKTQKGYDYIAEGRKDIETIDQVPVLEINKEEDIYKYVGHASYEKILNEYNVKMKYQNILYKVSTNGKGEYTITIVDEKEPPIEYDNNTKSEIPKTGDENDINKYAVLSSTSLLGALSVAQCLKLTKKKNNN